MPIDPRQRRHLAPVRVFSLASRDPDVWIPFAADWTDLPGVALVPAPEDLPVLREGGALLFDFGAERHGGCRLVSGMPESREAPLLRIRFGESWSEASAPTPVDDDHSIRDHRVRMPWCGALETGQTGFRFIRVDVERGAWTVAGAGAVTLERDPARAGSFSCSDPLLNEIWEASARTVDLCRQEFLWDGIKRDRCVWGGDLHTAARVVSAVFGPDPVVPESLDLLRRHTPPPGWINNFPSYSLWWIITVGEWHDAWGDDAFLARQADYLAELAERLVRLVRKGGGRPAYPSFFLDHPTRYDEAGLAAGAQALTVMALESAKRMFGILSVPGALRDGVDRAIRESRAAPAPEPPRGNKPAAALLALSGLLSPEWINQTVLAKDPYTGLSTWYGYPVLSARARAGDREGALKVLRRYWGGMLSLGATTFWEDFDLAWLENAGPIDEPPAPGRVDVHRERGAHCYQGHRHSLCHAWAGGPAAWMVEELAGIRAVAPGRAQLSIKPELCGLEWLEAVYPTPHGPVRVRAERDGNGKTLTRIKTPPQVKRIEEDARRPSALAVAHEKAQ